MTTLLPPDRFVLDGSVTLAWLFLDEQDPYADAIVARLPNLEMLVPRFWHLEVANVLLVGERRRRCSQADTTQNRLLVLWPGPPPGLMPTLSPTSNR